MTLLVDGHNLIPHIPGIDLSDLDDEMQLIKLLQEFCRVRRKGILVFFDQAPIGRSGVENFGMVQAHFVQKGRTADEAIIDQLKRMGKRARNVSIVSSDQQVQQAARAAHANVISSEEFVKEIESLTHDVPSLDIRNRLLSQEELAYWETMFKQGHSPQEKD